MAWAVAQTYLLALTGALYLLRGMIEVPEIGWRTEVKATALVSVVVLPAMAALGASGVAWGRPVVIGLSALGFAINLVALVRLWRGLTAVASLTVVIVAAYGAVIAAAG